ncbi:MAG: hypothetical protein LBV79_11220 [Candidatus Adiutrix sp.]|jgi:hypothetical protein|nr:hypothetical protein [Candidatus Adiutrix sp.]
MAASDTLPPERLTFWSLTRRTFAAIKEQPLFFGLIAIVMLPTNALEWGEYETTEIIVASLLDTLFSGAVVYSIFMNQAEGHFASLGQALTPTLRWPFIGFTLVSILLVMLVRGVEAWLDSAEVPLSLTIVAFFATLGLALGLGAIFLAAIPAYVVEGLGFFASLQRSLELTKGHRMRIFILLLKIFGLFFLASFPLNDNLLSMLVDIFLLAFFALIYCDLRALEEERV